jgi:hypothetical protein
MLEADGLGLEGTGVIGIDIAGGADSEPDAAC